MRNWKRSGAGAAILAAGLALGGCEAEDGAGGGTAPEISGLTSSATTVEVGKQQNVTLGFTFADPDGDVAKAHVDIAIDGVAPAAVEAAVAQAAGVNQGAGQVIVALIIPKAGEVTLRLTVIDAAGNDSNTLETKLTAQ